MNPTEYEADIFLKFLFFWRHAFRHQNLHLWNATVASLNTTVASLEHNRHIFGAQRTEESDYNTVIVLITTL